jgi:hypothetical protein
LQKFDLLGPSNGTRGANMTRGVLR